MHEGCQRRSLTTSLYAKFWRIAQAQTISQEGVVKTFKRKAGCAIFLVTCSSAALGQDASGNIEEVVVTGIRKSIEDSIAVKKNEDAIVEVVSAEDIGKLPDSSIAESIARLPGLAAQRTNGRAQTLSIRGLGPDFTVTTFNGREQASTNDNRTVEFDQYPSELVTQVKIYKTPDAGMAYQGIAGTTDIATVHPLAYDGRRTAATYRREYNDQEANIPGLSRNGDRGNLTYIDQFREGTVGVAFGAAYNKTPYQARTREPWGYPEVGGALVIGGDKDGVQSSFYERMAYLGVLEFQPNDRLHMLVDAYHSDFQELQTIQRIEFGTIWAGATLSNPGPVVNGRIQSGTFANVPFVVIENYNNDRDAQIDSIGWNTTFELTENWNLASDVSWSKVEREDLRLESTAGTGTNNDPARPPLVDSISFTTDGDGITHFRPTLNYSDYNTVFLTDPGGWGGGRRRSGFVGNPEIEDEIKAIRLSAERKLGSFVDSVSFGANYAERVKSKDNFQSILYLPGDISHAVVPTAFRTGTTNTAFFGSPFGMIGYDAIGLYRSGFWQPVDAFIDPNPAVGVGDRQSAVTNDWEVTEKLTTAFVKVGIDTQIGSLPLRGNIGLQSVTADQSSDISYFSAPQAGETFGSVSIVTSGAEYTEVLPSLNLALELPNDMKLRFGAAITVARPRMDDLAGGAGYTVISDTATPENVGGQLLYWRRTGGGNPELEPWKANAFDLSLEKYFGDQAYVSVAAYYKKLVTYIFNSSVLASFEGVLLPGQDTLSDPVTGFTEADANRLGVVTTKVNGSGGYIRGAELTVSLPLSIVSDVLDGFGFIVSGAVNESSIDINGVETPVPGLSEEVVNTTLYFEKYGFSARISNRYRGEFIGEVPEFDSSLTLKNVSAESLLDAQIGYEFQEGLMKGLSVSVSGTNLTDEPFTLSNVDDEEYNLIKHQEYGAVYSLAVTYKF
jgi:iron complex outermembrane receptor protein